jgi:hypothetical protein
MIYGTRHYKSGRITGELKFNTGKRIFLNVAELIEFKQKIKDFIFQHEETKKLKDGAK